MAIPKKVLGLGRGLDALIGIQSDEPEKEEKSSGVIEIDINKIEPNKEQPRKYFDEDSLNELAESLKEFGIIQPIIVKAEGEFYKIIAGERRFRAARIAKLAKVPVIVKDYTNAEMIQLALIENIQRQDLNPIEEAWCYKRLIEDYFFTQESLSLKVGKSRNVISYSMSLLVLDNRVQTFIIEGKISAAHGRILLQIKDNDLQFEFAEKIIEDGLSSRDSEREIKAFLESCNKKEEETPQEKKSEHSYSNVESDLKNILGTHVKIVDGKKKGKIEIEYYSPDDLDRLLGIFKRIDA